MGIVEETLVDVETGDGTRYRVEKNVDGSVHLHTEHVRVEMEVEEFVEFAEAVLESREELLDRKEDLSEPA